MVVRRLERLHQLVTEAKIGTTSLQKIRRFVVSLHLSSCWHKASGWNIQAVTSTRHTLDLIVLLKAEAVHNDLDLQALILLIQVHISRHGLYESVVNCSFVVRKALCLTCW